MKVLVVSTVSFQKNGIISVIMNYYNNINKADVHMDFVGPSDVLLEYLEVFHDNNSNYFKIDNRKRNPIKYCMELFKICKKNDYDIIHVHGSSHIILLELLVAKLAGIKIRVAHSHNSNCDFVFLHKFLTPFFNMLYTVPIACGEEAGRWMFGNKEFKLLKNGVCLEKYKFDSEVRKSIREKLNISEESYVLGHIGGFNNVKNQQFILSCMESLKKRKINCKCVLIGDGPLFENIKSQVHNKKLDEDVILLGLVDKPELYYNSFDLFLLPSLYEGFPMVLVEAQANGLPCLVSNNVTKKTNITNNVHYVSIESENEWVDYIVNSMYVVRRNIDLAQRNLLIKGYSSLENAKILHDIYLNEFRK